MELGEWFRKECGKCGLILPVSDFRESARDVEGSSCRRCNHLAKYGLTKDLFRKHWVANGGTCDLCGRKVSISANGVNPTAHIDHDHSCHPQGSGCPDCVRGILCPMCNVGLVGKYEALPSIKRSWPVMNTYLAGRPFKEIND